MPINYEDSFYDELMKNKFKQGSGKEYKEITKKAYFRALIQLKNEVKNFDSNLEDINIFSINDVNVLENIRKRLLNDGDMHEYNRRNQNTDTSAGLNLYIEYIQKLENNKTLYMKQTIKNIILYGSPGVGKTYNTNKLIRLIEDGMSDREIFDSIELNDKSDSADISDIKERVKFITFHQSFGYEDFIEGFRPNENGDIKLQDGIFKTMCDDASRDRDNNYYLVIDEINRGNISKIFGELITLIEEDKRDILEVTLPYSKQAFKIPSNLYIIGTMNSTDKSIALIDIALRRWFTFLKMKPNLDLVKNEKAKNIMNLLNEKITETLGEDYVLGHSYFMKIESDDDLGFVMEYKIQPLLEEYFYGDVEGLKSVVEIING